MQSGKWTMSLTNISPDFFNKSLYVSSLLQFHNHVPIHHVILSSEKPCPANKERTLYSCITDEDAESQRGRCPWPQTSEGRAREPAGQWLSQAWCNVCVMSALGMCIPHVHFRSLSSEAVLPSVKKYQVNVDLEKSKVLPPRSGIG